MASERDRRPNHLALLLVATVPWACGPRRFDPVEHLRAIVGAEAAFADANGGGYGSLECLREPARCAQATRAAASPLLSERQASPNPAPGWASRLYLGPSPTTELPEGKAPSPAASPLGATTYAVVLAPVDPLPGEHFYCADDTGTIRSTSENRVVTLAAGRCPREWEPLGGSHE